MSATIRAGFFVSMKSLENRDSKIQEAASLFLQGMTYREIGRTLGIVHPTAKKLVAESGLNLSDPDAAQRRAQKLFSRKSESISSAKKSVARFNYENCIRCLSRIGLGKRVISRVLKCDPALAFNVAKRFKKEKGEMRFLKYRSTTEESKRKRLNLMIARSVKDNIRSSLRNAGLKKDERSQVLIGCSITEFKDRIESLFSKKMSWDNYGRVWHLDHIIPISKFNLQDQAEILRCFHWTNYRPLAARRNMSEGARRGIQQQQLLPI